MSELVISEHHLYHDRDEGFFLRRKAAFNLFLISVSFYLAAAAIFSITSFASSALTMRGVPSGGSLHISGPMYRDASTARGDCITVASARAHLGGENVLQRLFVSSMSYEAELCFLFERTAWRKRTLRSRVVFFVRANSAEKTYSSQTHVWTPGV